MFCVHTSSDKSTMAMTVFTISHYLLYHIKRDRINVLFSIISESSQRLAGGAADVIVWRWTSLKVDDVFTFSLAFTDDSPVVV